MCYVSFRASRADQCPEEFMRINIILFFFSSRRRHTRFKCDWSSDVCSSDLARYLHVHQSTIYRLLRQKELPAFKVGSDWRFNLESIDKWRFGMAEHARKKIQSRPL